MPLHPPLSDYPNTTTNHALPTLSVPTTILIASAGAPHSRSSPFAPPASLIIFSLPTVFFSYRDTRTICAPYDRSHPSVSPRCSRDRPHQYPPVLHGPLLTRLWCRKHDAIGCKLNLGLSLRRGSRIGYDAMICTTSMRRHALLLIALAHSAHFLSPRCSAIAMMLFFF
jgi:hypothetical protein